MTLVLLMPIGLDGGSWTELPPAGGKVVAHVFRGLGGRPRATSRPAMASLADAVAQRYDGPQMLERRAEFVAALAGHLAAVPA